MNPCSSCDDGTIRLLDIKHTELPYMHGTVKITVSALFRTCDSCGEMVLSLKDIQRLQLAIDLSIRGVTK